jgi:hypothetical protein
MRMEIQLIGDPFGRDDCDPDDPDDPCCDPDDSCCEPTEVNGGGCWEPPSPGPGPPPNPPPPPPDCMLELEYRPAGITGVVGATHASIMVTDGEGYTFTIQGEPHNYPFPPWGKLDVSNTTLKNINDKQWGPLLTSANDPSLCDQVAALETAEFSYSNDEVNYYPWGPNSNSLVHWLLTSAGVSGSFTAPPGSKGWNKPLYGTFYGIH